MRGKNLINKGRSRGEHARQVEKKGTGRCMYFRSPRKRNEIPQRIHDEHHALKIGTDFVALVGTRRDCVERKFALQEGGE